MIPNIPRPALLWQPARWLAGFRYAVLVCRWIDLVSRAGVARKLRSDSGMSTAEYAIGTIAAAAFAAILYTVVTGDSIVTGLSKLVQQALSTDL